MILVTGANGLFGKKFKDKLGESAAFFATRAELDITDADQIRRYLEDKAIDTIINCAAGRDAEALESEPELAQQLNVVGPRNLAMVAKENGAALIHFSTDYVFDGAKNEPYTESDTPNPLSVYGRTKWEGEQAVLNTADTALVLRVSWFFAESLRSFTGKIVKLARERETLSVVFDQVGSPCYIDDLVADVLALAPRIPKGSRELYHLGNQGVASWYDVAHQVVRDVGLPCKVVPIRSSAFPMKAHRPAYSVLDKAKIVAAYGLDLRHYTDALAVCAHNIKAFGETP